ncbi:hypothetical protein BO71DRAFT_455056 [Aspergillus ellipticus CBS 707.79]|uniref:Uncharacterized protein n=1 Tax=Aspergillus ellipticus CBS 707.79 TaxID=1448320 RepID=A0A319EH86_9EURO|nr:hypothetical protein BO71DRAFT_455056 [Aspergillus ellipticus CBS 707.79]
MAGDLEKLSSIFANILGAGVYQDLINNPSPDACLAVGEKLHKGLSNEHLEALPKLLLTDEQRNMYTRGVLGALESTPDAVVEEAKQDTKECYDNFKNAMSDGSDYWFHRGDHTKSRQIYSLQISTTIPLILSYRATAVKIMTRAEDFDDRIIPLCADPGIPVAERLEIIQNLAREAQSLQNASEFFADLLSVWQIKFLNILLGPALPATTPTSNLREAARKLTPEPTFASGLVSVVADSFDRPSAFVKISGLLAVGALEAKNASLLVSAAVHSSSSANPQPLIDLADIVAKMESGVSGLRKYWRFTADDFHESVFWLQEGAKDVDIPKYMRDSLERGAKYYLDLSKRLKRYALALGARIEGKNIGYELPSLGLFKLPGHGSESNVV